MNPDIYKHGKETQFKPGNKMGRGRKPSMLKRYIKEVDLSMDDITAIFKNIIFTYNEDEIKKIANEGIDPKTSKKVAAGIWGFCKAFIADSTRGWGTNGFVQQMLDRSFGSTPKEVIKHDGKDIVKDLSQEERKAYLDSLIKERLSEKEPEKKE